MKLRMDGLKNFGFVDEVTVIEPGINAKMNEFQAALGLLQLKHVGAAIAARQSVHALYSKLLSSCKGIVVPQPLADTQHNYAYFPVLVQDGYRMSRDALYDHLRENGVIARRYFYPLISDFPMYRHLGSAAPENLETARRVASQVICLPIYPALEPAQVERICSLIVSQ